MYGIIVGKTDTNNNKINDSGKWKFMFIKCNFMRNVWFIPEFRFVYMRWCRTVRKIKDIFGVGRVNLSTDRSFIYIFFKELKGMAF